MKKATKRPRQQKSGSKAAAAKKSPAKASEMSARAGNDWRNQLLSRIRDVVLRADPDIVEDVKWRKPSNNMRGVPVWSHGGILCTGETYKDVVKLTFPRGAALGDPDKLFNASLAGGTRRAIDFHEGDPLDEPALADLIRAAAALNLAGKPPQTRKAAPSTIKPARASSKSPARKVPADSETPTLLSGGNPQIAKGHGDAPVEAYLAAMPGWKRAVGRRLDELIVSTVPGVNKAVKWNTPLYGVEEDRWFVAYHCFTKYVKVTFFRGASLRPKPPGESKQQDVRHLDIYEDPPLDDAQFISWVQQASRLPGEKL